MLLCVVISSLGRTDRLPLLLKSLAAQTRADFEVGVCDQSTDGSVSDVVRGFASELRTFTVTSRRGLSRGRNAVIRRADDQVTHFAFPNDTSTLPQTFVADLYERHPDADVLAMAYLDGGIPRHAFPASHRDLDLENVWQIIEPAMVLSRRAIELAGGFDESLGSGADTPWQSGEGTDLLLGLRARSLIIHWDPELTVNGVAEDFSLSIKARRAKLRDYGRGYGYVLSTWDYPWSRRLKALGGPIVRAVRQKSGRAMVDSIYASTGRTEGIIDGVRDGDRRRANMLRIQVRSSSSQRRSD